MLAATRAFALNTRCPVPPMGSEWVDLADGAGVLTTVLAVSADAGHALTPELRTLRLGGGATSLRTAVELRTVTTALDAAGLRWVVLKGPVLAEVVYRQSSSRSYDDLDVLVHPADLGDALDALELAGFALLDRNWVMIADSARGEISLQGTTGTVIDLHWHPVNEAWKRRALDVDVVSMLERRIDVVIDGSPVPSLAPDDLVVYVALHASLSGGHRLKWLLDLQQAVRWSGCTPEQIAGRAEHHGLGLIVRTMLDRAAEYLDPGLSSFAATAGRDSAWVRLCRLVSQRALPLSGRPGHRSGHAVFGATRQTTATSAARFITDVAEGVLDRARGRDAVAEFTALQADVGTDIDRHRWLAASAAAPSPNRVVAG